MAGPFDFLVSNPTATDMLPPEEQRAKLLAAQQQPLPLGPPPSAAAPINYSDPSQAGALIADRIASGVAPTIPAPSPAPSSPTVPEPGATPSAQVPPPEESPAAAKGPKAAAASGTPSELSRTEEELRKARVGEQSQLDKDLAEREAQAKANTEERAKLYGESQAKLAGIDAQRQQIKDAGEQAYQKALSEVQARQEAADKTIIDPDHYYKSKGTAANVGLAISAGLTQGGNALIGRGGNPILDLVSNAIDRDIDSQKENKRGMQQSADRARLGLSDTRMHTADQLEQNLLDRSSALQGVDMQLREFQARTTDQDKLAQLRDARRGIGTQIADVNHQFAQVRANRAAAAAAQAERRSDKKFEQDTKLAELGIRQQEALNKTTNSPEAIKKAESLGLLDRLTRENVELSRERQSLTWPVDRVRINQIEDALKKNAETIENAKSQASGGGTPREKTVADAVDNAVPGFFSRNLGNPVSAAEATRNNTLRTVGGLTNLPGPGTSSTGKFKAISPDGKSGKEFVDTPDNRKLAQKMGMRIVGN